MTTGGIHRTYTDNQLVQLYLNAKGKRDIMREYDMASSLLDRWKSFR